MNFRKSNENDINKIMEMIEEAKEYFKSNNIDQWQDGYPNYQVILDDINKGYSFVFIENDNIVASVAVSFEGKNTYDKIYEGQWLSIQSYCVIHRLVVDSRLKGNGISSKIIKKIEEQAKELDLKTYFYFYSPSKILFFFQKLFKKDSPIFSIEYLLLSDTAFISNLVLNSSLSINIFNLVAYSSTFPKGTKKPFSSSRMISSGPAGQL